VSCFECSDEATVPLRRNVRAEYTCRGCHVKMAFQTKTLEFDELTDVGAAAVCPPAAGGGRGGGKRPPQRIVAGQPLPDRGACQHFRRSLRWLRFRCCGRAFACPICHELDGCEGALDGVRAHRMICGQCGTEQNFCNKPCESCGFKMGLGKSAAHWQGGSGARNVRELSSKDSRKNKGESRSGKLKTASKKSQRVGAAGKAARDA